MLLNHVYVIVVEQNLGNRKAGLFSVGSFHAFPSNFM